MTRAAALFVVRWLLTVAVLAGAYHEAGAWTTAALAIIAIRLEIDAVLLFGLDREVKARVRETGWQRWLR